MKKKDTVYSNKICVLRSWRILCSLRWRKECFHIRGTSKIFSKNFQFLIAYSNNFSHFVDHCICSVEERIMYVSYTYHHVKRRAKFLYRISLQCKKRQRIRLQMTMDKKRAIFLESLSDRTARFLVCASKIKKKRKKKKGNANECRFVWSSHDLTRGPIDPKCVSCK